MIKRFFDVLVSLMAILLLMPVLLLIGVMIRLDSRGPALYWSQRVGRDNQLFAMPKFRTMKTGAPVVATHLLHRPEDHLTSLGVFLRRTSLDELPQLWSILCGEMSLVGPRPALFNQDDLVQLRTACGVHSVRPGLTGWAQINGRDDIAIPEKVALDRYYVVNQSMSLDMKILLATVKKVMGGDGVSH